MALEEQSELSSYGFSAFVLGSSILLRPWCRVPWLLCGCSDHLTSLSQHAPQCPDLFSWGYQARRHPEPWYWQSCLGQDAHCPALALPLLLARPGRYRDWASLKGHQRDLSQAHDLADSHQLLLWLLPLSAGPLPGKASTMCNRFVGTWKLISSENFDDYMKELGEKWSFFFFLTKLSLGMSLLHLMLCSWMIPPHWTWKQFNYFPHII